MPPPAEPTAPQPPTYSLRAGEHDSEKYYRTVSTFTDEVLTEGEARLGYILPIFDAFLRERGKRPGSNPEYLLELLNIGTLWRTYGSAALDAPDLPVWMLQRLNEWRRSFQCLKPVIDAARGVIAAPILTDEGTSPDLPAHPSDSEISSLLSWLSATGEFSREVQHYSDWRDFMMVRPSENVRSAEESISSFADWFEHRSLQVLGEFTTGVEGFLQAHHASHTLREDAFQTGRRRVEYHLNMVGAEMLNRAYRHEFIKTERKAIVAPSCLKLLPDGECQAETEGGSLTCTHCSAGCKVHQLSHIGEKLGVEVVVFPHSSDFAVWSSKLGRLDNVGIVGITCAVNLIGGGWEAQAAGIPVQCVLLDYSGCARHWDVGISTDFNARQLSRILL